MLRNRKKSGPQNYKHIIYEFGQGGKVVEVGGSSESAVDSASSQPTEFSAQVKTSGSSDQVEPAYMGADLHHTSSQSEAATTSNSSTAAIAEQLPKENSVIETAEISVSSDQAAPAYMGADLHQNTQETYVRPAEDDQQPDEMLGWVNLDAVGANQTAPAQNPDLNPIVGHVASAGGCFIS